jgi:drug/metabolite transporter (DMT)-like permease
MACLIRRRYHQSDIGRRYKKGRDMPAVLLALAAALSYGGSDFAAGLASRGAGVIRVSVLAEVTCAVVLLSIVPFISRQEPTPTGLAWGAVAGIGGAVGGMALFAGFRHAAFSVASSVSGVGAAAFTVLAGMLLGQRPSALALTGIALALPALVAVSASTNSPDTDAVDDGTPRRPRPGSKGRQAAGIAWGLIAGAGFGLFYIALNRAGSSADIWPLAAAELGAIVTVILFAAITRQLRPPSSRARWLSVLSGITMAPGPPPTFSLPMRACSPSRRSSRRCTRRAPSCSPGFCSAKG